MQPQDEDRFKHHLGNLYMDDELLSIFKEAAELLRPDGYFLTLTRTLALISTMCTPTSRRSSTRLRRSASSPAWSSTPGRPQTRTKSRCTSGWYSATSSSTSGCTTKPLTPWTTWRPSRRHHSPSLSEVHQAPDLTWVILTCPELFAHLAQVFERVQDLGAFDPLRKTVRCRGGNLDCTDPMDCEATPAMPKPTAADTTSDPSPQSINSEKEKGSTTERKYKIPLCGDGDFSGSQLLAAFTEVMVTYYWIEKL